MASVSILLMLVGCVGRDEAREREEVAQAKGYSEGHKQGAADAAATFDGAFEDSYKTAYNSGFEAGERRAYAEGYRDGERSGFESARPGRTPSANPSVDLSFRVVSVLGGVSLLAAILLFCLVLVFRSKNTVLRLAKGLAALIGAVSMYILYMTMGFGDAVSNIILAPAPPGVAVYGAIIAVAIVTYGLFAIARGILEVVASEKLEAICILGMSAAGTAIAILLTRVLSVTPSIADYWVSAMLAGFFLGSLFYVMMWMIDRARGQI